MGPCAHVGAVISVHESVYSEEIIINSVLQAISTRIIYLPPGDKISLTDLSDLFSELPTLFIIVGDFNAHNSMCGSTQTVREANSCLQII